MCLSMSFSDQLVFIFLVFEQQMSDKKQQEMKEEITAFMRKKDYYDILGISKTASDSQIKKAYRMLALRFHPDKNQVQGAKQVFKKVSNAYSHLIDPEKRQRYDQVGPQQDRPQPQNRRNGAGAEDFEYQQFQDIFQAFFGGMQMNHQRRRHHFRAYQQNFNQQGRQQQVGGFNFYYIFVLFFLIYTILPLFQSSPNYSTSATYQHRIRRTTSRFGVEFFVNQKYTEQAKDSEYKRKSEMEIDRQFLLQLQQKCEYMKNQKRNLQVYAYQHREGSQRQSYLNRAKNVDLTTCRYLQQLSNNHQDYIRELTYMRY